MKFKLKTQYYKRYGSDLPTELAYNVHLDINEENSLAFERDLLKTYEAGKEYFVVPKHYVMGQEDCIKITIKLKKEWFEEVKTFNPEEYHWYNINQANNCIIRKNDTILVRDRLGKINIIRNKPYLLNCDSSEILKFMIIHIEDPK